MYVKEELKPKKISQDTEGRMLAVGINTERNKILMVDVYAPNGAKEKFFNNVGDRLNEERYDNIILMGDFNAVSDTKLDKTSKKKGGKLPNFFYLFNETGTIRGYMEIEKLRCKGLYFLFSK